HPFQRPGGGANDTLASLSAGLGSLAPQLRSVTVVGSTPVVGGLGGVYRMLPPPPGCPEATWTKYGTGLPNDVARSVLYDLASNTLGVGTMGRGVWTVASASTTIAVAGQMSVTGDGNGNTMELRQDPSNPLRIVVSDGIGNSQSFDKSLFSGVQFFGLGGADLIRIRTNGNPGD